VSELVADEMAKRYNIPRPIVIHNVFPWGERGKIDGQVKDRKGSSLSLYWYSQVIGEGRGIEDAILACGLLKEKVQIHLRGSVSCEVKDKFLSLARDCGIEKNLYFHQPVPAAELLSRTVEHDVGLALEQPFTLSRRLSVTNKFFFYLLAGLAIAATDIPGQRCIMSTCPGAGFLYAPGDYQALAGHLNRFILEPKLLQSSKQAALGAAQERWNWERESKKLIENITNLLK
jgi:glycosyltransferase involved in cell wall biosynthesis